MDVKRDTCNIDPAALMVSVERVLAEGKHKPAVVIAVDWHLNIAGETCECPVTERLCESVLCLPIHPYLNRSEAELICEKLREML